MPNFDWRNVSTRTLTERFPDWARGVDVIHVRGTLEGVTRQLMEERRQMPVKPPKPRVFVSHRRADVKPAERIAYLACQEGFEFWLDVLDPQLATANASVAASAAAIASVIEMGLLNSTHVIAVMTPNTHGSQWVPYEYGRVKEPVPVSLKAASWVSPALTALPE